MNDKTDHKTDHETNLKIYDALRDYLEKSRHFHKKPMRKKPSSKMKKNRHGYPSIECSPEQREKDEKRIREMMSNWWG